jgi:Tol biopolymer transport system component
VRRALRPVVALAIAAAAAACGRLRFAELSADDASQLDSAADAAPDVPDAFDPTCPSGGGGAFSAPVPISVSTADFEGTPALSSDGLELFFKSTRPGGVGGQDLWTATRTTTALPWSTPVNVTELNSPADDTGPTLTADGLTMWFESSRTGGLGDVDIYVATRPARGAPWSAPVLVTELSSISGDGAPHVSPSGLIIYQHSSRSGSNATYRSTRASITSPWSMPVELVELGDAANPATTADDCSIVFGSFRTGGQGSRDLWIAERPARDQPFGTPTVLAPLNGTEWDDDPWLSADGRHIVFASNRNGGTAEFDLFEATR